jgi:hypothetical protein
MVRYLMDFCFSVVTDFIFTNHLFYTFFATFFPNNPIGLTNTIARMIKYTTAFCHSGTTKLNNPVSTGINTVATSGPKKDEKLPKIAAIKALTCVGVIKPTDTLVALGVNNTAATAPKNPAIAQLIAVMILVFTPIMLATNSLEAVALTPNPHLVNLNAVNNIVKRTTLIISAEKA